MPTAQKTVPFQQTEDQVPATGMFLVVHVTPSGEVAQPKEFDELETAQKSAPFHAIEE